MLEAPSLLFTLLAFVAVLAPLVFIHEFGHYWVARKCGIRAETFSVGIGREVAGWTDRAGTRWKVGWLPLGGYVKFAGDEGPASGPSSESAPSDGFLNASLPRRAITVLAGPLANLALALLILSAFALVYGKPSAEPVVGSVVAGSAAAEAGLIPGDHIVALDGERIESYTDIAPLVVHRPGETLSLTYERGGARQTVDIVPKRSPMVDRFGNRYDRGLIGIRSGEVRMRSVGVVEAPIVAVQQSWMILKQTGAVIGQMVTGRRSISELGGPVAIAKSSGEQATLGWRALLLFAALISLNLAVMNLLPLPMLDGGHLLFMGVEAIRRRPVSVATQAAAYRLGFAMLLALMVVVTINDLGNIGLWQRLSGLIG